MNEKSAKVGVCMLVTPVYHELDKERFKCARHQGVTINGFKPVNELNTNNCLADICKTRVTASCRSSLLRMYFIFLSTFVKYNAIRIIQLMGSADIYNY